MRNKGRSAYHKLNCIWPVTATGAGWKRAALADRIEAALKHLVRTPYGSILADPEYGTTFYLLQAQAVALRGSTSVESLSSFAIMQCKRYVPDAFIQNIQVVRELGDDETMTVRINWSVPGVDTVSVNEQASPRTTDVLV